MELLETAASAAYVPIGFARAVGGWWKEPAGAGVVVVLPRFLFLLGLSLLSAGSRGGRGRGWKEQQQQQCAAIGREATGRSQDESVVVCEGL